MAISEEAGLALLRLATDNPSATFRRSQEELLQRLFRSGVRVLLVGPAGWGKTLLALLATRLIRRAGGGPTLIVTPEVTNAHRDVALAERLGLDISLWTSENDWHTVGASWRGGKLDVLLINAVRSGLADLLARLLAPPAPSVGLLLLEHAHTLSTASPSFEPTYRHIQQALHLFGTGTRIVLTAPALKEAQESELRALFGPDLVTLRAPVAQRALLLQTAPLKSQAERYAWLAEHLPQLEGPGIVYTGTKRDAQQVTEWLNFRGIAAESYTATQAAQRTRLEANFLRGRVKALVVPLACGGGMPHPDLRFIIHYDPPPTLTDYYRQLGLAGIYAPARALVMAGAERIHGDETEGRPPALVPTAREVQQILTVMQTYPQGVTPPRLAATVNAPLSRIRYALHLLTLASPAPVKKVGGRWRLTQAPLPTSFLIRLDRLRTVEQESLDQVRRYLELAEGHWDFLAAAAGVDEGAGAALDPAQEDTAGGDDRAADSLALPAPLSTDADSELIADARCFLRRGSILIEPRKQWPPGGLPRYRVRGRLPQTLWARQGKALCIHGDSGWGELVAEGKRTGRFSDELVEACVRLYHAWHPVPAPQWVTCIPSLRHPHLVPDFAARLARALNLPFRPVLVQTVARPPQQTMANSTRHALNVDGTLRLTERPPQGPVLLVDDIVDSRWTFTIAAWLLRQAGVAAVFPLALASHYGMPVEMPIAPPQAAAGESS